MNIPTDAGSGGEAGARALFEAGRRHARGWLAAVIGEVRQHSPTLLPALAAEDWEDLLQETEVALWTAARRYARHGAGAVQGAPFPAFAQVQVRAALKAYVTRWWCDPDFQLLPDLEDRPYASVFCLWPDV